MPVAELKWMDALIIRYICSANFKTSVLGTRVKYFLRSALNYFFFVFYEQRLLFIWLECLISLVFVLAGPLSVW